MRTVSNWLFWCWMPFFIIVLVPPTRRSSCPRIVRIAVYNFKFNLKSFRVLENLSLFIYPDYLSRTLSYILQSRPSPSETFAVLRVGGAELFKRIIASELLERNLLIERRKRNGNGTPGYGRLRPRLACPKNGPPNGALSIDERLMEHTSRLNFQFKTFGSPVVIHHWQIRRLVDLFVIFL